MPKLRKRSNIHYNEVNLLNATPLTKTEKAKQQPKTATSVKNLQLQKNNDIQNARRGVNSKTPEVVFASDGRRFFPCSFCYRAFAYKKHQKDHIQNCVFRSKNKGLRKANSESKEKKEAPKKIYHVQKTVKAQIHEPPSTFAFNDIKPRQRNEVNQNNVIKDSLSANSAKALNTKAYKKPQQDHMQNCAFRSRNKGLDKANSESKKKKEAPKKIYHIQKTVKALIHEPPSTYNNKKAGNRNEVNQNGVFNDSLSANSAKAPNTHKVKVTKRKSETLNDEIITPKPKRAMNVTPKVQNALKGDLNASTLQVLPEKAKEQVNKHLQIIQNILINGNEDEDTPTKVQKVTKGKNSVANEQLLVEQLQKLVEKYVTPVKAPQSKTSSSNAPHTRAKTSQDKLTPKKMSQAKTKPMNTQPNTRLRQSTSRTDTVIETEPETAYNEVQVCSLCNRVFATAMDLLRHKRVTHRYPRIHLHPHELERYDSIFKKSDMSQCVICTKPMTPTSWPRHLKTHSNEKSYLCRVCKKAFSRIDHRNYHEKRHVVPVDE